jgi:hypothetical protein
MKTGMVRVLRSIGLGLALAGVVTSAQAVCSLVGQVIRVQVGVTTAAGTFVYLKTFPTSGATYVGSVISSSPFVQAAVTAAASGTRVQMIGNIAACPAVAAGAIGNIGTLTTFIVNP